MKTVVTTAYRPTTKTTEEAARIADLLGCTAVERRKRTIEHIQEMEQADVVVAAKKRLEYYPIGTSDPFFFHPSSAAFRTKRQLEEDPFLAATGLSEGDSLLDCTLGMASDAIMAAVMAGSAGRVVGCESQPVIGLVVKEGLQRYDEVPRLCEAMQRIEVVLSDAVTYLQNCADGSFDIVYMDPMFSEAIGESSNFTPIRQAAVHGGLTEEWVTQAKRVAKRRVVLKAHFRSTDFEEFGFERKIRPNTKFHFGVIYL